MMEHRPSTLIGVFGNPLQRPLVDRAVFGLLLVLPLALLYAASGEYFLANPELISSYADLAVTKRILWIHTRIVVPSLVLTIIVGLLIRKKWPNSEAFAIVGMQIVCIAFAFDSYCFGQTTSQYMPVVLLSIATLGHLLIGRRPTYLGIGVFLTIIFGTMVGEQFGLVPHAPFMSRAPFSDGQVELSWLLGFSAIHFITLFALMVVIYFLIERLHHLENESRWRLERLKSTQARLVQSERMSAIGRLVAGVAHEMNNPASLVIGAIANLDNFSGELLDAIDDRPLDDEKADRIALLKKEMPTLLAIASEGADRIYKIVRGLRDFSRSGENDERVPTNVKDGIETTLFLLGDRLKTASITVSRHYQTIPDVLAAPGKLNQLWMNLLVNAVDAMCGQPAPCLDVSIRGSRALVEIEIRDNGAGLAPGAREHLFEPFFTTKPIGQGTGLGLSISYGIVQDHGGTLEPVEHEPGLSMLVRLPALPSPSSDPGR